MHGAARFDAIRTTDWTYVQYGDGDSELYDLTNDPYQLENRAGAADPLLVELLAVRLAELMNCAGVDCRELEDLPVEGERTALHEEPDPPPASAQ
jgi:arylsulfatase A-like enzyme